MPGTIQQNPVVDRFEGERLDLWSLKKPTRPAVPKTTSGEKAGNAVDRFLFAAQEQHELSSQPEADRRTLIRRFQLLQPHRLAADAGRDGAVCEADPAADAYQRLVERLLASPRYGEQAGRLWLDVVRYADTNGFEPRRVPPDDGGISRLCG